MIEIKNKENLVEELAEMLMNYDKDLNQYETDVYLYVDRDGNGTLDEFVNVGGNSWRNDNHYTIHCDPQRYEDIYDQYNEIGDFAWALGKDYDELMDEVRAWMLEVGDVEDEEEAAETDPDWYEVREYIKSKPNYIDDLQVVYEGQIDSMKSDYITRAEQILSDAEKEG